MIGGLLEVGTQINLTTQKDCAQSAVMSNTVPPPLASRSGRRQRLSGVQPE
jgi:hypothetical protein